MPYKSNDKTNIIILPRGHNEVQGVATPLHLCGCPRAKARKERLYFGILQRPGPLKRSIGRYFLLIS